MSFRGTTTGPTAEMARRASRIVCVEDFIRDMENRGEDGYFVSSKWLLSLQEHETESLMSVLRRAGYSGTYQTRTTTLFARIEKDHQYGITYNDVPGTSIDTAVRPGASEVGRYSPKWGGDPSVEIAGKTLKNIDLNAGIADISKSETLLLQTVSSKDYGGSILVVPSEAESTRGNVLQQLQKVSREQYQNYQYALQYPQYEGEQYNYRIANAEANAEDIWELMPGDGKIPSDSFESHIKEHSWAEHRRPGGAEEKMVEASTAQDKKSLATRQHKKQKKLKRETLRVRVPQRASQEAEERSLLEQTNTEKQPGIKTIAQEKSVYPVMLPSSQDTTVAHEENDYRVTQDWLSGSDAGMPDWMSGPDAAFPGLDLTEIKGKPQRRDEEETLPGIGEHEGATWKSFKVPPQSIKEEPHQSIEEETLPGVGEHQGATWKSFKAALQSKIHQSFCVSTQWLSNFKDHEDEALKAGYEKISQAKTATWYQKSRDHHVKSPAGGACDDDSYKVSNRHGGVNEPGASTSGNFRPQSGPRQTVDNTNRSRNEDVEHKTDSFAVATERKRTWVQHGESTCHPQLLRVACSSPSHTRTELSSNGLFHKQQFGDSVVTMPGSGAKNISTTIEKPFSVMKIDFSGDGRGREVPVDLKAIATTSLSCCLKDDHDSSKVRIKFSRISGDVKTDDSYEESCNAMVLSSSYTSVYGCIRSNSDDRFEEINLNLEDEYHEPPRRRVLANAPGSSGELATTSVDLVWLEISGRTPNNCEPGSLTLALRGDIAERRKEDSLRQIQGVHPLLFKEPRPVIFGGDVTLPPDWFLEFRVRSQLEVSYFKPWTPISEEGPVWPANDTTKVVDFGCCLAIRAEDLRLH